MVYTLVVYTVEVTDCGGGGGKCGDLVDTAPDEVSVAVTGQIVVYKEMMSVVTRPTGQFVIVGAQDVMVYTLVA
jgi:hypothetical protein